MKRSVALFIFLCCSPALASATPFNIDVQSEVPGSPYVTIHAPGTLAHNVTAMVGSMAVTGDLGAFEAYCVDLQHYLTPPASLTVDPLDKMSNWNLGSSTSPANAGGRAAWLYNNYAGLPLVGYTPNEQRWGLQVAIWNALYDTDLNVTAGEGFRITGGTENGINAANAMLAALGNNVSDASWLRTFQATNDTQDLVGPAVPEPGTLLLLGTGLIGLSRRARARRTK